jgi:hypothetical protein
MHMRHIFILVVILFNVGLASAKENPLISFKISRPYCVFNFLETCKGVYGTSDALKQYIEKSTATDTSFAKLISEYKSLYIETTFFREGFPETRPSYRSVKDFLIIAAVQSKDIPAFKARIVGILHNTDYSRLISLMEKADVYYEQIIWKKHGKAAMAQLRNLENYQSSVNEAFFKLKRFYNSSWTNDIPFTVALTPVPGKDGSTAATPHANVLCADVLTEESNSVGRLAIVLHEICHVLYAEQSRKTQVDLESCFAKSTSPYATVARNFFDEGMATACGNGWVYQFLAKKIDTSGWYSDPYIDGFGHALFPLVSQYLSENKSVDSSFVENAIRLFGERFPNSLQDYGIQFNHLTMYSDEEKINERSQIKQNLYEQFAVTWLNFSTPIQGTESITFLKESGGTQFIIVDRNQEKVLTVLKNTLPELRNISYNLDENFVINYYDSSKRLIVIAKIKEGETRELFRVLKKMQYMDTLQPYWRF